MDPAASRRPLFTAEADAEPGFSGNTHLNPVLSRPICWTRSRSSLRNMYTPSTVSSPRSGRFFDSRFEDQRPHFLESCFLCKKPLGNDRDIFMYRGDTPFCSEACRQEQMEMDVAREKNRSLSSMKAMRKKEQRKSASPSKGQECPLRPGTVAAA